MSRVETKRLINNVKIRLKLYENGEMVYSATLRGKTRVLRILQWSLERKWDSGTCRVVYNSKKEFYNEFDFTSIDDVVSHLSPDCCLDPYLVKNFA